jgi:hypothetical protein
MVAGSISDNRVPLRIRSTAEQQRAGLVNRAAGIVLESRNAILQHPDSILAGTTLAVTTPEETASVDQAADTSRHRAITTNRARSGRIPRRAGATTPEAEAVRNSTTMLRRRHTTVRRPRNAIVLPQRRITTLLRIVEVAEAATAEEGTVGGPMVVAAPTAEAGAVAPTVVVAALTAVVEVTTAIKVS